MQMNPLDHLFREALGALNNRRLPDAERLFKKLLSVQPEHVGALNCLTVVLMSMERFPEAEQFIAEAVRLNQTSDASFYNYGLILKRLKKPALALQQFDNALRLNGSVPETWNNRGTVLTDLHRYDDAVADFDKALELQPRYSAAYYNKGNALSKLGRHEQAFAAYDKALALTPDFAEAWLGRGNSFYDLKRYDSAFAAYDKALQIKSDLAEAWLGRGNVFYDLKRTDEALAAYDRALQINPGLEDAWLGRGNVFYELKRGDEAFAAYDKALEIKPDLENAWVGRGNVFQDLKRRDEAFVSYDRALEIKNDSAGAWLGRGNVLFSLNRDAEAMQCYDQAIALEPDLAKGYFCKALLKLSLGEYEEGWRLYEWRRQALPFASPPKTFNQPLWLGEGDVGGKTVLVHCEQGFGDTFQFYRYVPLLQDRGCRIVLETHAPLAPLIKAQNPKFETVVRGEAMPEFDVHVPLLSLPLAFKTTLATIPAPISYLASDAEKSALWRSKLGAKSKPRIGLVWSGRYWPDVRRSIALELLLPMIDDTAEWHSLQNEYREGDHPILNSNAVIVDHAQSLHDFADTAALIATLDLVITIDTAVAHLAGALGKSVWIFLPFHPDFRWLRDREDSPWYPTAKLFRQTRDGEWKDVIDRVGRELKTFIARG